MTINEQVEACFQRHFNHITPGTPRWHELQSFKADLIRIVQPEPEIATVGEE